MSVQPSGSEACSDSSLPQSLESPLFKLSAELRNQIYELCLIYDRPLFISCTVRQQPNGAKSYNPNYSRGPKTPPRLHPREPGLLRVSRRIRSDALAMFYGRNAFQAPDADLMKFWLFYLGSERRGMLTAVRCGTKLQEGASFQHFMAWHSSDDWGCRIGSTSYRTSGWTLIDIERVEAELERGRLTIPEGALRVLGYLETLKDEVKSSCDPRFMWMSAAATADGMSAQEWERFKKFRVASSAQRKLEERESEIDYASSLQLDGSLLGTVSEHL